MLLTDFATHPEPERVVDLFTDWCVDRGITLYPAQEEALLALVAGSNVILATPTGSGKSLVAVAAHLDAMARGKRSYYTAPIKALVSEKFFDLCSIFGPANVGMVTGDSSVNTDAPIICCTAEILANLFLREGAAADVDTVIMDEFHFYADPQRGWAWQIPLLEGSQSRFLLMSATLGDVTRFADGLEELTGRPCEVIANAERPIPLDFRFAMTPVHETIEELLEEQAAPVYVVHFAQREAIERAQSLMSVTVANREERDRIGEAIAGFKFSAGFGATLNRLLRHGIGVHHAGMLPKYRRLVEQLAQAGLLKVICGTDTLGVGINVPIRTVLITALSKYDGERTRLLTAREFHQIAGRAGRAGFDTAGSVVVQAPEHVVDNERALKKAQDKFGADSKKVKQVTRKKPPAGFVSWGQPTFDRLVAAEPEALTSTFRVSHSMALNVLDRDEDQVAVMRRLIESSHEPRPRQLALERRALGMLRELVGGEVVERVPDPAPGGRVLQLQVELPADFALDQPLSPFALAALSLLDPESPSYALDVVSVIESTLEPPRQVLSAQTSKARGEAVAQMKADGLDYETRMARLEEITYPQPLLELLEDSFETYRRGAPWIADFELTPKSIVRDMVERAMNFGDYVQFLSLARSEGVLLRYLTDAHKALRRTVPVQAQREDLTDIIEWLGELVRQVDSSLADEWERLNDPDAVAEAVAEHEEPGLSLPPPAPALTDNPRALRVMVRNALFRRVEMFALEREEELGALDGDDGFTADRWGEAMDGYFDEHDDIGTGATARGPALLMIDEGPSEWKVRQIFDDPADHHDWGISAVVDLAASNEAGTAVVRVTDVGRL